MFPVSGIAEDGILKYADPMSGKWLKSTEIMIPAPKTVFFASPHYWPRSRNPPSSLVRVRPAPPKASLTHAKHSSEQPALAYSSKAELSIPIPIQSTPYSTQQDITYQALHSVATPL